MQQPIVSFKRALLVAGCITAILPSALLACSPLGIDLSIEKAGPAKARPGETITYNFRLRKTFGALNHIYMIDTLPSDLTYVSDDAQHFPPIPGDKPCSMKLSTLECHFYQPPDKQVAIDSIFSVQMKISESAQCGSVIKNSVRVFPIKSEFERTPNDNVSETSTTILCDAPKTTNLTVEKTGQTSVKRGENISYTVTAKNVGEVEAKDVKITDTLPVGTTFVSSTLTSGTCIANGQIVTCTLGTLPVGGSVPIAIVVKTDPGMQCGPIKNVATISGTPDSNVSDNTAAYDTNVTDCTVPTTDISVTKSGPATVNKGGAITYTVVATNLGDVAANSVVVTDTLPANVTFLSSTSTSGTCSANGQILTCQLGTLAAKASVTMTITVQTNDQTPCSVIRNNVSISGTPNSNTTNDYAYADTSIICQSTPPPPPPLTPPPPPPPVYLPPPPYYAPPPYQPPIYTPPPQIIYQPPVAPPPSIVYPITGTHDGRMYTAVTDFSSIRESVARTAPSSATESPIGLLTALLSATGLVVYIQRKLVSF